MLKTYGTILRNNPIVEIQYKKFTSVGKGFVSPISLPDSFDGREAWKNYLSPIRDQGGCGGCYAYSTTSALSDRYSILTLGQVKKEFSAVNMITCEPDLDSLEDYKKLATSLEEAKKIGTETHKQTACFGNSLYNAIKYLYMLGVPSSDCQNANFNGKFKKLTDFTSPSDIPICEDLEGIDHDICYDETTPMRLYRAESCGTINANPLKGGSIEAMKYAIFKFGPLCGGFDVYPDFVNEYDGKTIYDPKPNQTPTGGHAISILGYGNEKGVDYWIIRNSWGEKWGEKGYFRMKMGVCSLQDNIVVFLPYIQTLVQTPFASKDAFTQKEKDVRAWFRIEPETRYPYSALVKIKQGKLKGDLTPILNQKYLPDYSTFIAGKIAIIPQNYPKAPPFDLDKIVIPSNRWKYFSLVILILILIIIIYYSLKSNGKRKKKRK